VESDGDEAHKGPNTATRRGAEDTSNPKSSTMLHLGEFGNLALAAGASVVPELEAVHCNRHDTRPVEYVFLSGRQSAKQVPKHSHGANHRDCFGSIEAHMLMEEQVPIKEAKVPPMVLRLQQGFFGEWPPTESKRGVSVSTLACEVEEFRLVIF
jgi:hypothetical protein